MRSKTQPTFTIGILDMFGSESFKQNSLEQLMINTANEELQNAFYRHSILYDQEAYQRENIAYPKSPFKDNKKVVDLLLQVINEILNKIKYFLIANYILNLRNQLACLVY